VRVRQVIRDIPTSPNAARYDEYLLVLALREPTLLSQIEFLTPEDFDQPDTRAVFESMVLYNARSISFDVDEFVESLDEVARETGERLRDASKRIQFDANDAPRELQAAGYRLQLQRYQNELTHLRFLLGETSPEEQRELTQRVSQLSSRLAETKRALDARTIIHAPARAERSS
jgi:hypothetical protein